MGVMQNGMVLMNVSSYLQTFVLGVVLVTRALAGNPTLTADLQRYDWVLKAVGDVVVRVAFDITPDELAKYQQEADATGRDVRLVAAYHEVQQLADEKGIEVDLGRLVGMIESEYQRLLKSGLLDAAHEKSNAVAAAAAEKGPRYDPTMDDPYGRGWHVLD